MSKTKQKWYAGKKYRDAVNVIRFGFWEEVKGNFQGRNHSLCKGFDTESEARKWVMGLMVSGWEIPLDKLRKTN